MVVDKNLHDRLIELQSIEELERKAAKAASNRPGGLWTQEEIDWIKRRADEMLKRLSWK
jgi:hypothetical protein